MQLKIAEQCEARGRDRGQEAAVLGFMTTSAATPNDLH